MTIAFERQFSTVKVILDAEDAYARELGTHGRHPRPMGQVTFLILGTITPGTIYEVVEDKGAWLGIKFNGQVGYVYKSYVKIHAPGSY